MFYSGPSGFVVGETRAVTVEFVSSPVRDSLERPVNRGRLFDD